MPFDENQIILENFIYQVGTNQVINNDFSVHIMLKLVILHQFKGHKSFMCKHIMADSRAEANSFDYLILGSGIKIR